MERHLEKEETCAICLTDVTDIIKPVVASDMFVYCELCIRAWLRNHDTSPRNRNRITTFLLPCTLAETAVGITATVDWNHPIDAAEKVTPRLLESTIQQLIEEGITPVLNNEVFAQAVDVLRDIYPGLLGGPVDLGIYANLTRDGIGSVLQAVRTFLTAPDNAHAALHPNIQGVIAQMGLEEPNAMDVFIVFLRDQGITLRDNSVSVDRVESSDDDLD